MGRKNKCFVESKVIGTGPFSINYIHVNSLSTRNLPFFTWSFHPSHFIPSDLFPIPVYKWPSLEDFFYHMYVHTMPLHGSIFYHDVCMFFVCIHTCKYSLLSQKNLISYFVSPVSIIKCSEMHCTSVQFICLQAFLQCTV